MYFQALSDKKLWVIFSEGNVAMAYNLKIKFGRGYGAWAL